MVWTSMRKVFRIGTVRYNWPMSAHALQAFSIAHCTDSEDFPSMTLNGGIALLFGFVHRIRQLCGPLHMSCTTSDDKTSATTETARSENCVTAWATFMTLAPLRPLAYCLLMIDVISESIIVLTRVNKMKLHLKVDLNELKNGHIKMVRRVANFLVTSRH